VREGGREGGREGEGERERESERERKKHSRMYHLVCQRIMENGVRTHAYVHLVRVCAHHFPLFSGTLCDTYVSVFFSLSRSLGTR